MSKLNYNRYGGGQSIASTKYRYDEDIDKAMKEFAGRMAGMWKNMPKYRKELVGHKLAERARVTALKKNGREKAARRESEVRMVEAVRKCVEMLEFHMTALMENRQIGGERLVNQIAIHNVIVLLRTKCGVKFEGGSVYNHHIEMDRPDRSKEQALDEVRAEMAQQHQARLRAAQLVTERLKARPKSGTGTDGRI